MFERGDLVLIPFPFSDLSAAKKRPVLLLTRPDAYGDFIVLAGTSCRQIDHGIRPRHCLRSSRSRAGQSPARELDSDQQGLPSTSVSYQGIRARFGGCHNGGCAAAMRVRWAGRGVAPRRRRDSETPRTRRPNRSANAPVLEHRPNAVSFLINRLPRQTAAKEDPVETPSRIEPARRGPHRSHLRCLTTLETIELPVRAAPAA